MIENLAIGLEYLRGVIDDALTDAFTAIGQQARLTDDELTALVEALEDGEYTAKIDGEEFPLPNPQGQRSDLEAELIRARSDIAAAAPSVYTVFNDSLIAAWGITGIDGTLVVPVPEMYPVYLQG